MEINWRLEKYESDSDTSYCVTKEENTNVCAIIEK